MNKKTRVLAALGFSLLAGLFLAGCGASRAAGDSRQVKLSPEAVRQVVAADNAHNRTIMWQMKDKDEESVEYREKGEDEVHSVKASSHPYTGGSGVSDSYIYTASLSNLDPGTTYEYRVANGNAVSEWKELKTDKGSEFTALVFPDSQSSHYSGWEKLAHKAWEENPDASFFINMGDLVDNGEDEHQWQAWFNAVSGIIDTIPVAPVMGNHENYSLDWKLHTPDRYMAHFQVPSNGIDGLEGHFYSFDWGDTHIAVLDTQQQEENEQHPDLFEKEKEWLKKDMESTSKTWKIVLMHKDPLQYAFATRKEPRAEGFSPEGEAFMPLFDELGIDLVLSAHLHSYRDRGHIYNFTRSERGPLYIMTGVAGDVRYDNLWKQHALDEFVAPQPDAGNYLVMHAGPHTLEVTAYLPDGTKLHTSQLSK
jgi:hypothetical protein